MSNQSKYSNQIPSISHNGEYVKSSIDEIDEMVYYEYLASNIRAYDEEDIEPGYDDGPVLSDDNSDGD